MLKIQEMLHAGVKLDDLEADHGICVKYHDSLPIILLDYDQISAVKTKQEVMECRGLCLHKETFEIIQKSFTRFFNVGEYEELTSQFNWNDFSAWDKIDGCCDGGTLIETEDGYKTIQSICEEKYNKKIKVFDIIKEKVKWEYIQEFSMLEKNGDWYVIEFENEIELKLTGEHRIWCEDLKCYRKIKDLIGNEQVLYMKK